MSRKLGELSRITHHTSLTSHHITQRRSSRAGSEEDYHTSHITRISPHHSGKKFLGRKLRELSHITHHSHLTTVRELPRKMNIEEVEEPKKYENYHAKPVSDPLKSIAEHRKVRELPRKMNLEEVEGPETTKIHMQNPPTPIAAKPKVRELPRKTNMQARNYENYHGIPFATSDLTPRPFTTTVRTPSFNHTVWGITWLMQ